MEILVGYASLLILTLLHSDPALGLVIFCATPAPLSAMQAAPESRNFEKVRTAYEARPKEGGSKTYVLRELPIKGIAISPDGIELQAKRGMQIIRIPRDRLSNVWASAGPREMTRTAGAVAMLGGLAAIPFVLATAEKTDYLWLKCNEPDGVIVYRGFQTDESILGRLIEAMRDQLKINVILVPKSDKQNKKKD